MLIVLRGPLIAWLVELCGGQHRARLWWRVAAVAVTTGSALCASLALAGQDGTGWLPAIAVVRGAAAGLLLSVTAVAAGMVVFARQLRAVRA